MFVKKNKKQKILAIILAILLWLNPLVVPVAWAEGEENQPPVENVEVVSSEASFPPEIFSMSDESSLPPPPATESTLPSEPSPSPSLSTTEIQTGEANALSEIENEVNTNQETLPGEITVSPADCSLPEGEATCSGKTSVTNNNSVEVSNNATSSANTGSNKIEDSDGEAIIQTGNVGAGGLVDNQVNTNVVDLEPLATPSGDTVEEENASSLNVENKNEGEVKNDVNIEASSGENSANQNTGSATILTGDVLALANILNFLNTNIVGSDFELFLRDILGKEGQDINLNQLWKEILVKSQGEGLSLAGETNGSNLRLLIENFNQAYLENNVNVGAKAGGNQANENGIAVIETGDATAVANVNNFVNTNILGAEFFLGVINILGDFEGNLILPRPENFSNMSGENRREISLVFYNRNQAEVENNLSVKANTGENKEENNGGETIIETGNGWAVANVFSLVNLNFWRNNWFVLLINNLGNWTGKIFGWSTAEAVEEPEGGNQVFQLGFNEPTNREENVNFDGVENLPLVSFQNQNQAIVKNNIQVSASTGENQANNNQGEAQIKTGSAFSLANLLNFVNLNILGGRWFFGLVNILGNWRGNTIFAYPDVTVSLSNRERQIMVGETAEFSLVYKNQGYEEARGVILKLELPEGVAYLSDDSGYSLSISGKTCSWSIGTLSAGEVGEFKIRVEILPDFPFEEELSFWSKIIPKVLASENQKEKEIQIAAFIKTSDPESDSSNNSALAKTLVYLPFSSSNDESFLEEESNRGIDQRQPVLEIFAWNNVGEFVYPGDTVTFEIKIRNKGEVPAYDVYLTQSLHNGLPKDFGVSRFLIGKIEPGRGAKLTFGIKLNGETVVPEGHFYTLAQAFGRAPNGNEVISNEARTDFDVRHKQIASLFIARATGKEEEILGVQEKECLPPEEKILPYVLLFILSSLWMVEKSRRVSAILKGSGN